MRPDTDRALHGLAGELAEACDVDPDEAYEAMAAALTSIGPPLKVTTRRRNLSRAVPLPRPQVDVIGLADGWGVRVGSSVWAVRVGPRQGVPAIELGPCDPDAGPDRWASLTDDGRVVQLDDAAPWTADEIRALHIALLESQVAPER